jgi:hypothetical protein
MGPPEAGRSSLAHMREGGVRAGRSGAGEVPGTRCGSGGPAAVGVGGEHAAQ